MMNDSEARESVERFSERGITSCEIDGVVVVVKSLSFFFLSLYFSMKWGKKEDTDSVGKEKEKKRGDGGVVGFYVFF